MKRIASRNWNWRKYLLRKCNSLHSCALCSRNIHLGEQYFDGGYGRRVHALCVRDLEHKLGRRVDDKEAWVTP